MDLGKLLTDGQTVWMASDGKVYEAQVVQTSCMDYERKYLIRFQDGSSRWINQVLVRHLLTKN